MTDLSVSIVNTTSRDLLLACLESLRGEEAEIVVLDNASEDGSADAVRERFPDVRLIAHRHRAGFGANHNTVIRATSGRYVYVLNEDTTSDDWGFRRLVDYLDRHPRVAAVGPRLVYPEGRPQPSAWRFPSPVVSLLSLPSLGRVGIVQSHGDSPRPVGWVMGAALLLRREALDDVGLFDEDFFVYYEDFDLSWRGRSRGWRYACIPTSVVRHRHASTLGESTPTFDHYVQRNRLLALVKNAPLPFLAGQLRR